MTKDIDFENLIFKDFPQLTKEQAVAFHDNQAWRGMSFEERARFQLTQELLCMPFDVFHEAITKALDRDVYTHEFGMNWKGLCKELFEGTPAPTMKDIIEMIPEEKRIVVIAE